VKDKVKKRYGYAPTFYASEGGRFLSTRALEETRRTSFLDAQTVSHALNALASLREKMTGGFDAYDVKHI
jgi:hypothetical protein